MPLLETRHFGKIEYQPESLVEFPAGLPGFEDRRRFVPVTFPANEPIIYLQSEEDPALCFITLPVWVVDPQYRLRMSEEDRALIGLAPGDPLEPGPRLLCLAVLSIREDATTANLLAPVVVNLAVRRAVQAIAPGSLYSWQHPVFQEETEPVAC